MRVNPLLCLVLAVAPALASAQTRRLEADDAGWQLQGEGTSVGSFAGRPALIGEARFLHAITRADTMDRPSWAGIAAEAGFTDQSHLIRDCRSLTGYTPAQLFRERRQESEISNPDRV